MHTWQIRDRVLQIGARPLIMGIVNVTPDSFSDGGQFGTTDRAVAHALDLVAQAADILDIGGESTRPGSHAVAGDEEMRRVLPVIQMLAKKTTVPLSVDTSKAAVARACLDAGAHIINDVTAMADPLMPEVVRASSAGIILMHMQGTPATMQFAPHYDSVIDELMRFFEERLVAARASGIATEAIAIDPGIGFGKKAAHNIDILARLEVFQRLGRPLCLGVSRKGLLGKLLDRPVDQRLAGSLAVICHAMAHEAAQIVRVHDVRETRDVVIMTDTLKMHREIQ